MQLIQQILFALLVIAAIWLFAKKVKELRRNILLGRDADYSGNKDLRWKNVLLLAFGQKKMFKYPLVAVMHFVIYAGFIIINLEILEIILDGVFGTHRLFAPALGPVYGWLINGFEILAFGVLTACVIFLVRRNVIKVNRLNRKELEGWPQTDANVILITEIILMVLFLTMNAADKALQLQKYVPYHQTAPFFISGFITPAFAKMNPGTLVIIERT